VNGDKVDSKGNNGDRKIDSKDIHAMFCVMLHQLGGSIAFRAKRIKEFPEDVKFKMTYDDVNDVYWVVLPRKRKKIMEPSKKIITP